MPKRPNDPESPELTADFFARARRGTAHLPAGMQRAIQDEQKRRGRGPQKAPTKERITIRLDRELIAAYRATGNGWQGRLNADLARAQTGRTMTAVAADRKAAKKR